MKLQQTRLPDNRRLDDFHGRVLMRPSLLPLAATALTLGLLASACTAKIATNVYEKRAADYAKQKVDEILPEGVTIHGVNDAPSSSSQKKAAKKLGQTGLADGSGEGSGEGSAEGSGNPGESGSAKPLVPVNATPVVTAPPRPVTSWNAVTFGGGNGLSCSTAIIITGASDQMVGSQAEYHWLGRVYPGYKENRFGQGLCGDKKTHVREITTTDGKRFEVIFDISSFAP